MNLVKLKELAAKADCTIDGMGFGEGNVEYFARLIVAECLEQCVAVSREYPQGGPWTPDGPDPATHAAYMASVKCRVKIKEHFGIE